jgi:hypothetical protein
MHTKREPWHGTRTGYVQHLCRCVSCAIANRKYQRRYQYARRIAGIVDRHGKRIR